MLQLPQSHKKGVTCITGIMVSQSEAVFASTSSDGAVHIWEVVFPSIPGGKSLCFLPFPFALNVIISVSVG